ncbi:MAG: transcription antitermination factor NusB [Candidatus Marinimicrobia bacterium]|jgi:N utilization substance protein B|nr:transcription antitermination factor NusB [Candidatus Neomarinimicrobiota bacterium]MCK9559735.1 transcription antitermination factor NusB [Candidatus Neomarinimicrobiota bacterium]MDD5061215.1 transcription antitermination factor NusB [Candidatus Neomarinimicrobiota bacterium]
MRERRAARELALQALYAEELTGYPLAQVVEDVIEESDLQGELKVFTKELFMAAALHRDELDKFIQDKSENWDFERIAIIDRLIIRMAICEFKYFDDIPPKVSISEAIEIAKRYSTDDSSAFVNGILDAVLHQIGDSITFKLNRSEANPVGKAE